MFASDGPLKLESGTVDVWTVSISKVAARWSGWTDVLDACEVERMHRFKRPEDRLRSGLSRAVLRRLVGAYLDQPPEHLLFRANRFGKPSIAHSGGDKAPIAFSVSHSGDYALLGFCARGLLGVDIESMKPGLDSDELAVSVCSAAEIERQARLCEAERRLAFFRRWVVKEAYLKALGVGLSLRPAGVEVDLGPAREHDGVTFTSCSLRVRGRWRAWLLPVPDGYAAAVVAPGGAAARIRLHTVG